MTNEGKELKKIGPPAEGLTEHGRMESKPYVLNKGIATLPPNFSETENKERIFRKTYEVIERPYLTVQFPKPKQRRRSPILRKCEDLMEVLWEDGYRKQISWHLLRSYVVSVCGGFRTTLTDYLGARAKYYTTRGREGILKAVAKQGYLERFGFVEVFSPKVVFLRHERVHRSYHNEQTNIVNFSHTFSRGEDVREEGALAPTTNENKNNNTQSEREINCLHESVKELSPEEARILKASANTLLAQEGG